MRTAAIGCAALLVLTAPFGEGGRAPWALFVLHLLVFGFAAMAVAVRRGAAGDAGGVRRLAWLAAAGLALAALSAARASYPLAALLGFMDLLAAGAVFLGAIAMRALPRDLRVLRAAFVLATAVQAALAIVRLARGEPPAAASFLNPNHMAAWLNGGLVVCLARLEERAADRAGGRTTLAWAALAALHALAALLLASRGALLGLAAALLLMGAIRPRAWSPAMRRAGAAALLLVLCAGGLLLARRFRAAEDPYRYHRARIWQASTALFADAPLLGAGPGMFRHVAPRRNVPLDDGLLRFERSFQGAHSGWLTLLVENGLPGTACLAAVAIAAAAVLLRARHAGARGAGLLLAALLVHALVEDLQARPALVLVPALLAGAALGARPSRGRGGGPPRGAPAAAAVGAPARVLLGVAALALLWAGVVAPFLADRTAVRARAAGAAGLPSMRRAARLNPLHPGYRHDLAMATLNQGPPAPERYAGAALLLQEARRLHPIDPRYALLLARLEADAGGRLFRDQAALTRAGALYREAAALAPTDPRPRMELAGFLLSRDPDAALAAARDALAIEPHFVRARLLEAGLLLDRGRRAEARAALERAAESRRLLSGLPEPSGYAEEMGRDEPGFRGRLEARLAAGRAAAERRGAGRSGTGEADPTR